MCDYSLHLVSSRPAQVGEKLVSTRFTGGTHGFAAVNNPAVAVCLLPGTEIAFEREIEFNESSSFFHGRRAAGCVARFRQVNMDRPHTHHDALELADGRIVLVHCLLERQHATVLQMPSAQHAVGDVPSEATTTTVDPETQVRSQRTLHATADGFFSLTVDKHRARYRWLHSAALVSAREIRSRHDRLRAASPNDTAQLHCVSYGTSSEASAQSDETC